jgi:hypothetical protein
MAIGGNIATSSDPDEGIVHFNTLQTWQDCQMLQHGKAYRKSPEGESCELPEQKRVSAPKLHEERERQRIGVHVIRSGTIHTGLREFELELLHTRAAAASSHAQAVQ